MNTKPQHLGQVDYIRCFAALGVTVYHLGGKSVPVLRYGWLGVEFFFVLSGFIICYSMPENYQWSDIGIFLKRRFIRIEPPYFFSILLTLLVNYFFWHQRPDWINALFHLAYLNNFLNRSYLNPVYWTLGIEFQFYLAISFLFPLLRQKFAKLILLSLGFIALYPVWPALNLTVLKFLPLFSLGIFAFYYKKGRMAQLEFAGFTLAEVTLTGFGFGWPVAMAGLLAVLLIVLPLKPGRLIIFFSKISFSLYLLHDLIGSLAVIYLHGIFPHSLSGDIAAFVLGFAAAVAAAFVFYMMVEKRFLHLSKTISYRPRQDALNLSTVEWASKKP